MKGRHASCSPPTEPPWKKEHPRQAGSWGAAAYSHPLQSSCCPKLRGTPLRAGRDGRASTLDLSGALRAPMRAEDLESLLSSHHQSSEPDAHSDLIPDANLSSLASKAPSLCPLLNGDV